MSATPVDQPSAFNAVLDTNVAVTIYSWHDILDVGDSLLKVNPATTLADPDLMLAYRRRRARTAFLLTLFFHEQKWTVIAPLNEFGIVLRKGAPPNTETANYTKLYLYFISELLPGWTVVGDLDDDANIKGDDVDLLCIGYAEQFRIPLISWEGDTPTGPNPEKLIPTESKARGIDLVTPELLLHRSAFDERPAINRFFAEWDARAPGYLKGNPSARPAMRLVRDFFERLADDYWGP